MVLALRHDLAKFGGGASCSAYASPSYLSPAELTQTRVPLTSLLAGKRKGRAAWTDAWRGGSCALWISAVLCSTHWDETKVPRARSWEARGPCRPPRARTCHPHPRDSDHIGRPLLFSCQLLCISVHKHSHSAFPPCVPCLLVFPSWTGGVGGGARCGMAVFVFVLFLVN